MSDAARNAARDLAVSYTAWNDAVREFKINNPTGSQAVAVVAWGKVVLVDQDRVGVVLVDPAKVKAIVDIARPVWGAHCAEELKRKYEPE